MLRLQRYRARIVRLHQIAISEMIEDEIQGRLLTIVTWLSLIILLGSLHSLFQEIHHFGG